MKIGIAEAAVLTLQPFGISRAELDAPEPNGLITIGNPPLSQ
jgi:hypothetical protein